MDARAGDAVAGLLRPATVLGEEEEDRQIARPREDTEEETEAEQAGHGDEVESAQEGLGRY